MEETTASDSDISSDRSDDDSPVAAAVPSTRLGGLFSRGKPVPENADQSSLDDLMTQLEAREVSCTTPTTSKPTSRLSGLTLARAKSARDTTTTTTPPPTTEPRTGILGRITDYRRARMERLEAQSKSETQGTEPPPKRRSLREKLAERLEAQSQSKPSTDDSQELDDSQEKPPPTRRSLRQKLVGGAMIGVGAVVMVTPLHPLGHALAVGGGYVLAKNNNARNQNGKEEGEGDEGGDTDEEEGEVADQSESISNKERGSLEKDDDRADLACHAIANIPNDEKKEREANTSIHPSPHSNPTPRDNLAS